jgi:hypothetical protein
MRDQYGRFTSPGAPKAAPRRDEYGRFETRTREAGRARLEPYRDEAGRFQKHPVKVATADLHKGVIGKAEFQSLSDDFGLSERELWDIYDQVYG